MEEPTPIPSPVGREKIDPIGAFRWNPRTILFGAGILALLCTLVFRGSGDAKKQEHTGKAQAVAPPSAPTQTAIPAPPVAMNQATGSAEQAAIAHPAPDQAAQSYGGGYAASPQDQERQQLRDQRRQFELKAAFAASVIEPPNRQAEAHPLTPQSPPPSPQLPLMPAGYVPYEQPNPSTPQEKKADELAFFKDQPLYILPEHTILPAVLDSRIEGEMSGPIDAMTSMDVYLPNSRIILIPAGSKILGESSKVSVLGQQRMAVAFHRVLVYPRGASQPYSISLDAPGLDQQGGVGLHDKVNNHYASIFGASLAIGLISGISQLGSYSNATYSPAYGFYNGLSSSASQNSMQVLDRFLNRMPTITIREGTRMIIETTGDLKIPAYSTEMQ
jgi:type IV secretory pathway VirB10-like protein